jgi:hypothetical protein
VFGSSGKFFREADMSSRFPFTSLFLFLTDALSPRNGEFEMTTTSTLWEGKPLNIKQ